MITKIVMMGSDSIFEIFLDFNVRPKVPIIKVYQGILVWTKQLDVF